MLSVEQALRAKFPDFFARKPVFVTRPLVAGLRWLLMEREVNRFLKENSGARGMEFIDRVLEYFRMDYAVARQERENIPVSGRCVIVANHPLGALDALALIRLVGEVRSDVMVVANDLLSHIKPLEHMLLAVDNLGHHPTKASIRAIQKALDDEKAVIMFPAGEVSRLRPVGVRDTKWNSGFMKFALKASAPIVPVYIKARNSSLFYAASMLSKPMAGLMLVREMNTQRGRTLTLKVGEQIPAHHLASRGLRARAQVTLVKKHLYRMGIKGKNLINTERAIAHPESRQALRQELEDSELLGQTQDGKRIFLFDSRPESPVMREIGRLREVTFRKVGEGTGKRRDLDDYDTYYRHIVLWDDHDLEVVGAYRIGECAAILNSRGLNALYGHSLFRFQEGLKPYLDDAIELGRSFVQPRYWGSRALDYLWQGIGAYMDSRPDVRFMLGPVSISDNFTKDAKDLMVHYHLRYFGPRQDEGPMISPRKPYTIGAADQETLRRLFESDDANAGFKVLKEHLAHFGVTVPTLYKQYVDLCEAEGVRFLGFNIDPDFANCVDGLIMLDTDYVKDKKAARYTPKRFAAKQRIAA
ncbi:MAG: lysophospholipid acyltransferase family protein [Gammaproteobacteria bacterium]